MQMIRNTNSTAKAATQRIITSMPYVLMVISDQEARERYVQFLTSEGYDVTAVPDGMTAIKRLARRQVDLVITDYALHGSPNHRMSGGKFIRILRRWKRNLPLILMSSHPNVSLVAKHYRAHGYFHRGDPLSQLAACITALLPNGSKARTE
ncbi:MAG: response regulator [Armatimonadota bacterium]